MQAAIPSTDAAAGLRCIVGLGNPGPEYAATPHNFGFELVDELARRAATTLRLHECQALTGRAVWKGQAVLLVKPLTFMNLSGVAVRQLLGKYERTPADLIVLYDDVDLPLGEIRIRERGSAGTHNGMRSLLASLGTAEFVRVRLGIHPAHPVDVGRYVLAPWRKADREQVGEVCGRAADAVEMILSEGVSKAMSLFNARPEAPGSPA
ncbi:MAG: aminoacyl-tRNA hydrolase [Terriglobales bacterium]